MPSGDLNVTEDGFGSPGCFSVQNGTSFTPPPGGLVPLSGGAGSRGGSAQLGHAPHARPRRQPLTAELRLTGPHNWTFLSQPRRRFSLAERALATAGTCSEVSARQQVRGRSVEERRG